MLRKSHVLRVVFLAVGVLAGARAAETSLADDAELVEARNAVPRLKAPAGTAVPSATDGAMDHCPCAGRATRSADRHNSA